MVLQKNNVSRPLVKKMMVIILLAMCIGQTFSQEQYTIAAVSVMKDTAQMGVVCVVITFTTEPNSFPVYAMADPERIVIDCPNTRIKKGIAPDTGKLSLVKKISFTEREIEDIPNVRIETFLAENAFYKAHISGKSIIVTINQTGEIQRKLSVFKSDTGHAEIPSVNAVDVVTMEKCLKIEVAFSALPKAVSVYNMYSPERIVMDFYNVHIDSCFEKEIHISPIKNLSVIKKDIELPYVGIVVYLERKVSFQYEQVSNRLIVEIPFAKEKMTKRKKLILISTGLVLTGGVVTGILMKGENAGSNNDLGKPPHFPEQ